MNLLLDPQAETKKTLEAIDLWLAKVESNIAEIREHQEHEQPSIRRLNSDAGRSDDH